MTIKVGGSSGGLPVGASKFKATNLPITIVENDDTVWWKSGNVEVNTDNFDTNFWGEIKAYDWSNGWISKSIGYNGLRDCLYLANGDLLVLRDTSVTSMWLSSDDGATYRSTEGTVGYSVRKGILTPNGNVVICTVDGEAWVSTDNGENYTLRRSSVNGESVSGMCVASNGDIVAVMAIYGGEVILSSDNGWSWRYANTPIADVARCVAVTESGRLISHAGNYFYTSDNNGNSWTKGVYFTTGIYDFHIAKDGRIIAVGDNGYILISDDDGDSWTSKRVSTDVTHDFNSIGTDANGNLWVEGAQDLIWRSEDNGDTWFYNTMNVSITSYCSITARTGDILIFGSGGASTKLLVDDYGLAAGLPYPIYKDKSILYTRVK